MYLDHYRFNLSHFSFLLEQLYFCNQIIKNILSACFVSIIDFLIATKMSLSLKKENFLQRQTMVKLNGIDEFFVTVQQLTYMKPRQSACPKAKASKMIDQILLM